MAPIEDIAKHAEQQNHEYAVRICELRWCADLVESQRQLILADASDPSFTEHLAIVTSKIEVKISEYLGRMTAAFRCVFDERGNVKR